MQPRPWWHKTALALLLFCVAAPFAARVLAGPPGGRVHVRWQASVDSTQRQRLEAQYRFADPEPLDDNTWRYDLIDPRTETIRAIVNDPAVADTHDINRTGYALDAAAVRTSRRQRFAAGDAVVAGADVLAVIAAILGALVAGIGLAGHGHTAASTSSLVIGGARSVQRAAAALAVPVARWLRRGIPDVDANTAGIFRVLFGLAVVVFFQAHPVDSSRLAPSFDSQIEGPLHATVLAWLRARPALVDLTGPWLLATGIAFTAGLLTRVSYVLFVAGAIVWAFVAVSFDSTHPHSTLILTLVGLLPSRWGDGFSIDQWLRPGLKRSPPDEAASRNYGYSVWVPGLIVGIAFAAAAWSKLVRPDGWTTWVLNGTVKYHFITDSVNAPVDWGLQLAAHPNLAILASFGAVAIEAIAITAAFTRSEAYRLGIGLGALSLVAGFRIFMGVLWLGWWIPLLGFLPWQRISALTRFNSQPPTPQLPAPQFPIGRGARLVTAAQVAMIVFLLGQQVIVSALGIERAPMFTHYPMYSYTFDSPEAFNAWLPPVHRIVVTTDHGTVELRCRANENLVEAMQAALKGSAEAAGMVWSAVRACRGEDLSGARALVFEEDKPVFDWKRLKLTVMPSVAVIGPLTRVSGREE
jgi:hypothetical protein